MNEAQRAEALERVRAVLLAAGTSPAEIARAERDDVLDLLVADRLILPAERRYTEQDVAQRTGMPVELAQKFWRALGFADVAPDERIFTDLDVEAILLINSLISLGIVDVDTGLQLARVIGSSMSRIAEAEVSPAMAGQGGPFTQGDSVESADLFARLADQALPAMARLLEFAWRRHVKAAAQRAMLLRSRDGSALPLLCVGFADMVGFTTLSQQLTEEELAIVVSRFEEVAHDTVTARGGRLVKMIGDEAMFVSESALAAAHIALGLAEAYADDELLSDVRVGLAEGPVLVQDGDYYGPVVNLAHRVVNIAVPGTVLLSDDVHQAVLRELEEAGQDPGDAESLGFTFRAVRPRQLKDLGRVSLWALHRPGAKPFAIDRRAGRRWERLGELLHEIDELRSRGERLISSGLRAAVELGDDDAGTTPGSDAP